MLSLTQVTFDDGSVCLGIDPALLRHPDEAANDWSNNGPDFAKAPPVKAKVGLAVAVWHTDVSACVRRLFDRFDASGNGLDVSGADLQRALFELSNELDVAAAEALGAVDGCSLAEPGRAPRDAPERSTRLPADGSRWEQRLEDGDAELVCRVLSGKRADGRITRRAFEQFLSLPGARSAAADPVPHASAGATPPVWAPRLVATKWALSGHRGAVLALEQLSVAMLIVSSSRDGTVRLWDPTSHPQRLVHPGDTRHRRVHPGYYKSQPEEWTATGRPYVCVHELRVAALPGVGQGGHQPTKPLAKAGACATSLLASVLDTATARGNIVLDQGTCAAARRLDDALAEHAAGPRCRGFLYLLDDGEVVGVGAPRFDAVFVTLSDASFFQVTGLLGLPAADAFALRRAFQCRHRVVRVLYGASFQFPTLDALRATLQTTGAAAEALGNLKALVSADLVVFGRAGDGPNRSVRRDLGAPSSGGPGPGSFSGSSGARGERFVRGLVTAVYPADCSVDVAFDHATTTARVPSSRVEVTDRVVSLDPTSPAASVKLVPGMRCRVRAVVPPPAQSAAAAAQHGVGAAGGGKLPLSARELWDSNPGQHGIEVLHALVANPATGARHLVALKVGRVSLRVPACDYDLPLPPAVVARASALFASHFCGAVTRVRAMLPGRLRSLARRNAAEAAALAELARSLRGAMLTRHQATGGAAGAAAGEEADRLTTVAFEAAMKLPLERTYAADVVGAQLFFLRHAFELLLNEDRRSNPLNGTQSAPKVSVAALLERIVELANSSPIAGHWLASALRCGLRRDLESLGKRLRGSIGWADLRDCTVAASALGGRLPSELVYALLRRFQNLFPGDASAEEFHAVVVCHALGREHPQARALLRARGGDEDALLPLTNSVAMGSDDFTAAVRAMDPVGRLRQQLRASELLMPASLTSWLAKDERPHEETTLAAAPPQLEHMAANEQLMAQGLTTLVTDEGALTEAGAPPLTFLQRYALMAEASCWLDQSSVLGQRIKQASAPVLSRGMALLVAPARAAAAFPGGPAGVAQANRAAAECARRGGAEAKTYELVKARTYHPLAHGQPWPASIPAMQPFEGWGEPSSRPRDSGGGESVAVIEVDASFLDPTGEPSRREALATSLGTRSRLGSGIDGLAEVWADVPVACSDDEDSVYLPDGSIRNGAGLSRLDEVLALGEGPPRYVVCERLSGWRSLRQLCDDQGFLGGSAQGLSALRAWGRQVALAVDACHAKGFVLRDITASNVFISPDGSRVKVGAGLGQAALLDSDGRLAPGTPALDLRLTCGLLPDHLPPEALEHAGRSVDSWGLGLVLLEAASGQLPPAGSHADGFFDFFSGLRTNDAGLASHADQLAGRRGKLPTPDRALVLQVSTSGGEGQSRVATSAILRAIGAMSTTVLLPRRVQPGAAGLDDLDDLNAGVRRLEEAWVRGAAALQRQVWEGEPLAFGDTRRRAASHFSVLVAERGGEAGGGADGAAEEVASTLRRRDKGGLGLVSPEHLRAALVDDLRYPFSAVSSSLACFRVHRSIFF